MTPVKGPYFVEVDGRGTTAKVWVGWLGAAAACLVSPAQVNNLILSTDWLLDRLVLSHASKRGLLPLPLSLTLYRKI